MDKEPIQDAWKAYAEKHNLDITFKELDDAFSIILHFEEKHFFPNNIDKHVLYKASNVLSSWVNWSHKRLLPSKSLVLSSEADILESYEDDLNKIIDTYQAQLSKITLCNLKNDESLRAQEIENVLGTWNKIQPTILELQENITEYWEKERIKHEE